MMQFSFDAMLALFGLCIAGSALFASYYLLRTGEMRVQVLAKPIGANDPINPNSSVLCREDVRTH